MSLADIPWYSFFEQIPWSTLLEILGFCTGILYLWWEYHADSRLWLASIIMPMISMWIYFHKGIYADFAINIYYFVIAIYGYVLWTCSKKSHGTEAEENESKKGLPITHIPTGKLLLSTAVFALLWGVLYFMLDTLTDSSVPFADSFTTALSIVAMWMLARKYLEQWLAWVAVDAVCVGLYFYKGIYLYAILYAIYTVIALVGYRKWKILMKHTSGH